MTSDSTIQFKSYFKVDDYETLLDNFEKFVSEIDSVYRPVIRPTIALQVEALKISESYINREFPGRRLPGPRSIARGEMFVNGSAIFTISIGLREQYSSESTSKDRGVLRIAFTARTESERQLASEFIASVHRVFELELKEPPSVRSDRARRLRAEGFSCALSPEPEELVASKTVSDAQIRVLALAIKAGGGLLASDLGRALPTDFRQNAPDYRDQLLKSGIVTADVVVICSKTSQPVNRLASRADIAILTDRGVRCACGKAVSDERIEEAYSITSLGVSLLDKSRWMTVILIDQLVRLGVDADEIYVEQQLGGDELDCIAMIGGEAVLFELKDGEFSLGHAYSFNSKTGIVRPDKSVIWTTTKVGNDAREHFERRRQVLRDTTRGRPVRDNDPGPVYIEGIDNLGIKLREMINERAIEYTQASIAEILPLAALQPGDVVRAWIDQVAQGDI